MNEKKKTDGKNIVPDKNKKTGVLGKLILPIILAITSFCTVYFLPREIAPHSTVSVEDDNVTQANDSFAPKRIATSFVILEPITVSIKGRSRLLRLGITLEVPKVNISKIDADNPKLRDAFMGYLSVLDMEQVEGAEFLVGLRAQLTRRAKFVLGENNIQNILITDFMVR